MPFKPSATPPDLTDPQHPALPGAPAADSDASSLDADAAALLADIASFDIEAARRRVQQIDARYTGIRRTQADFSGAARDLGFPEVSGLRTPAVSDVGASEAQLPAPEPAARSVLSGGVLEQLRDEVAQRQRGASIASQEAERLREGLDRSLRAVFDYCRDLSTQLNFLKPQVGRNYYLLDSDDPIRNLSWQEGYADFRTCSTGEGGNIERVSMGYTLHGPGQRSLERAGGAVERLRQMLFDLGLKFECQERRNRMRELESALFTVADEISVQVVWRADFEKGEVVVESRNLERLGFVTFTLKPEAICPSLLDEFGRLVLGRENRFRSCLAR
ncbi:MAG: hypothetical protein PHI64_14025 [Zoogloea sp.]|uniref:hypothetical protein n=1 Tax=Zoogloea sp. TaxID=49181 RepID=UPI00260CE671|nr:hypothetical protein [Zoogloea sp.]MDD2990070.1 hypothetical protein [Zoogloea sp.]